MNRSTRCPISAALHAFVRLATVGAMVLSLASTVRAQAVRFVSAEAGGANDGTSWDDAFLDLQDALSAAPPTDQIWVATAIYTPSARTDPEDPRSVTFQLINGVALYGGFAGFEDSLDERHPEANETILSGDLAGDDFDIDPESDCCVSHSSPGCDDAECGSLICPFMPECCTEEWDFSCASRAGSICGLCDSTGNNGENSYHVVTGSGTDETAVIDGFTITAGNADGLFQGTYDRGGGMFTTGGSPTLASCRFIGNAAWGRGSGMYNGNGSSPLVVGCTFSGNTAEVTGWGLGMFNEDGSSPTLVNCTFVQNVEIRIGGGGGIINDGDSNPLLINCRFIENSSYFGGAMLNESGSSPTLINCSFTGNQAFLGGAVYNSATSPLMVNCLFAGNSASSEGGAIRNVSSRGEIGPTLIGCTLSHNTADLGGGIFNLNEAATTMSNCILWGNIDDSGSGESAQIAIENAPLPVANYSLIQGLTGVFGGIGNIADDPLFVNALGPDGIPGTADDDSRLSPGSPAIDAADNHAVPDDVADLDGDGNTTEATPIDLEGNPRFLDDEDSPDTGAGTPPIVDMGAFEFLIDCNRNHIPDEQDIADGTSEDADGNGIPDECEGERSVVYSIPPTDSIDARQPSDLEGNASFGWWFVRLTMDGPMWDLTADDFMITEEGGDGIAPDIAGFSLQGNDVVIILDAAIEPGSWTRITHIPSATSARLGYLPGDVDGDATTGPLDILLLIDALNGVLELPDHATDIDRDGTSGPLDILREIDLLTGAGALDPWIGRSLPE